VDEHSSSLAASRWTMPLLKLGEKRYYLGIFFKVSLLPVTLIYLTEASTRPEPRTLSNYFQARNFPALPPPTVLRCIEYYVHAGDPASVNGTAKKKGSREKKKEKGKTKYLAETNPAQKFNRL